MILYNDKMLLLLNFNVSNYIICNIHLRVVVMQRKPGKMLKMSTEGSQQNKFILTSQIGLVE